MRDRLADKAPYQPQEAGKRKLKGKSEELIGCNRRKTFFSLFWGKGQRNCHLRGAQFALDYFVIKLNFSSSLGARLQRPFGSALLIFGIIRDNDERREKKTSPESKFKLVGCVAAQAKIVQLISFPHFVSCSLRRYESQSRRKTLSMSK
jgi:hypothetical protein